MRALLKQQRALARKAEPTARRRCTGRCAWTISSWCARCCRRAPPSRQPLRHHAARAGGRERQSARDRGAARSRRRRQGRHRRGRDRADDGGADRQRRGDADAARARRGSNAQESWFGETALMWAAAQNHAAAVRLLLEAGAKADLAGKKMTFARKVARPDDAPGRRHDAADVRGPRRRARGARSRWPRAAPISTSRIPTAPPR